jgi:hypothetical protein
MCELLCYLLCEETLVDVEAGDMAAFVMIASHEEAATFLWETSRPYPIINMVVVLRWWVKERKLSHIKVINETSLWCEVLKSPFIMR